MSESTVITIKGMNQDSHKMNLDDKTYNIALNANIEDHTGENFNIGNEASNYLLSTLNTQVIGKVYIKEFNYVLLFTTDNKIIQLKYLDVIDTNQNFKLLCDYVENTPLEKIVQSPLITPTVLIQNECLNFKIEHKIDIEYKLTDCTLNLYFVDRFNYDRFLIFDIQEDKSLSLANDFKKIIGYNDCKEPIYSEELDCNKLNWYEDINALCPSIREINGGNLKTGTYIALLSYSTSKGIALSNYLGATNPFPIFDKVLSEQEIYVTDKALEITINNVSTDTRYKYVNLVIGEHQNSFTEYKLVATIPITGSTLRYVYTGNEKAIRLTENDIFQVYPFYKSSKNVTIANNFLFKSNLEEFNKINIQRIANKLEGKLRWFTVTLKEGDYAKPEITQNYKTYLRDEVYSFGIQLKFKRGEYSTVGTIASRKALSSDLDLIPYESDIIYNANTCNPTLKKYYEVYNTAFVTKTNQIIYNECNPQIYQEGEFAYCESTELYPNNSNVFGELCSTPIRHHKFPDSVISHIHNNPNNVLFENNNYIFPLGVKLDDSVSIKDLLLECVQEGILSQEDYNSIDGYRIVRGNRVGNETVVARGLLYDVWEYNKDNTKYYYPNYPFNDLRKDSYLLNERKVYHNKFKVYDQQSFQYTRKYTFHSPDTHFTQKALGNVLKLETEEYGESLGFFNKCLDQAQQKILTPETYVLANVLGTILANLVKFQDGATGQGTTIGKDIGSAVGSYFGALGSSLGGLLGGIIGGAISSNNDLEGVWRSSVQLSQVEKILSLFRLLANYENYNWQYQGVGKYTNYKTVLNKGNKQRKITHSAYLDSTRQDVNGKHFNNYLRESSVYLELEKDITPPTTIDDSRFTVSDIGCDYQENKEVRKQVSSYYSTVRNELINQYGSVYSIEYLPLSCSVYKLDDKFEEFGGDSFINRFALKRKHSFFTRSLINMPNDTDIKFEDYPNVAKPVYYFNTIPETQNVYNSTSGDLNFLLWEIKQLNLDSATGIDNVTNAFNNIPWYDLFGSVKGDIGDGMGRIFSNLLKPSNYFYPPKSHLDCLQNFLQQQSTTVQDIVIGKDLFGNAETIQVPGINYSSASLKGLMYLYSYGIPYFICESGVNVDYRYAKNNLEKDFYPHQTDLSYWLQEKNVPIIWDNFYFYNKDYSKQNKEQIIQSYDINYNPDDNCKIQHPNRVIYSLQSSEIDDSDYRDNLLFFKGLNYYDFSLKNGKLISIDSIENEKVLVRFENGSQLYSAYQTLQTDQNNIIIDNGGLFKNRPQEYIITDEGYIGSQHTDIINTPFGHVFLDAKRGNVFLLSPSGSNPQELSNKGLKNWFKENLPFTILKYFKNVDVDNAYNGIGISLNYDNRFNRFFITKLDYEPRLKDITFAENKFYFQGKEISVYDSKYFKNKSWTVSYNFYTQTWVSFYSFKPNYYISNINSFITGLNSLSEKISSLWIHNVSNKSYQVFYGKLFPFKINAKDNQSLSTKKISSINYQAEVIRFHNKFDKSFRRKQAFNKIIIYNDFQTTGVLDIKEADMNNLYELLKYPKINIDKVQILSANKDNWISINDLFNVIIKENNNIPFILNTDDNVDKVLNLKALDYTTTLIHNNYLEGNNFNIIFINDKESNEKIIFKALVINNLEYYK